jgi:hypothetical protein
MSHPLLDVAPGRVRIKDLTCTANRQSAIAIAGPPFIEVEASGRSRIHLIFACTELVRAIRARAGHIQDMAGHVLLRTSTTQGRGLHDLAVRISIL